VGRFTTKDIIKGTLPSPITQNRYIYCCNNPATLIDPSGLSPETWGDVGPDDFYWATTDMRFRTFTQNFDLLMSCFDYDRWRIEHPGEGLGPWTYVFPRKDGKGYVLCVLQEQPAHQNSTPRDNSIPDGLEAYNKGKKDFSKLSKEEQKAILNAIAEGEKLFIYDKDGNLLPGSDIKVEINYDKGEVNITNCFGVTRTIKGSDVTRAAWGVDGAGKIHVMTYQIGDQCPVLFWGPYVSHDDNEIAPGKKFKSGYQSSFDYSWGLTSTNGGLSFYGFDSKSDNGSVITVRFLNEADVGGVLEARYLNIHIPGGKGSATVNLFKVPLSKLPAGDDDVLEGWLNPEFDFMGGDHPKPGDSVIGDNSYYGYIAVSTFTTTESGGILCTSMLYKGYGNVKGECCYGGAWKGWYLGTANFDSSNVLNAKWIKLLQFEGSGNRSVDYLIP
jgi:hypothetical protein